MDLDVPGEGSSASPDAKQESKTAEASAAPPVKAAVPKVPSAAPEVPSAEPEVKKKPTHVLASPVCRRFAAQHGVKLEDVPATGPLGRVTKEDVETFLASKSRGTAPSPQTSIGGIVTEECLLKTGIQKGMVKAMNASLTVPTMSIQEDIDMTQLSATRERMKNYLSSVDKNAKITVTTLLVKALSSALERVPIMNSKFDVQNQDRYTLYRNHNVSIAIDTPIGLLVPNIKNVESLSLSRIQSELNQLQLLARESKLGPSHLTGGTISISNVGVIGGTSVRPILFDGQATILGFGRVRKLPHWNERTQAFEPRDFMNVTATVDHRHVDGATVARFMKCFREILEQPELMLL